jgi:hypothetical protein
MGNAWPSQTLMAMQDKSRDIAAMPHLRHKGEMRGLKADE